jgi:Xaa-Pro aminopeptidase
MANKELLSKNQIKENLESLKAYLVANNIDAAYISSFDPYLSEYVPMENCLRHYITGFTGSVANVLVHQEGKADLYVDGRYWEQADSEVDLDQINVRKVSAVMGDVLKDIKEKRLQSVAYVDSRTPYKFLCKIKEISNPIKIYEGQVQRIFPVLEQAKLGEISYVDAKYAGKLPSEKIDMILDDASQAYYVTALDSIAWLTNCRGYHLPNLSSFISRAFLTKNKIYVFINEGVAVSPDAKNIDRVEFIETKGDELINQFQRVAKENNIEKVFIDTGLLNCADYDVLKEVFDKKLTKREGGLVPYQSIKDETELNSMIESFNKSNKAIFNTIKWTKEAVTNGEKVSEMDLYNQTSTQYDKLGNIEQSFGTISGVGANGSIIHYSDPKSDVFIGKDDMCLLDSGGYFEAGFATDTTRTFLGSDSGTASEQHKKMYTLVLKGLIAIESAVFPKGVEGKILDAFARGPLRKYGWDYLHGTGHGVGVHVHEGGVRISSISSIPMKENQVVSVEPGVYFPGIGGVRLENIVIVEKHPEYEGFLRFQNMVYIGYDYGLIDMSLLNSEEIIYLDAYEEECKKRGTSFLS